MGSPCGCSVIGYHLNRFAPTQLTNLLQANQISIEHRYFGKSKPEGPIRWETLTMKNAAHDQHVIIEQIKHALYPENRFISTGINKGGQTTMFHRSPYPDEVGGSVCYVAPLCFGREDPRIYKFLKSVGTQAQCKQIQDFQLMCLKKKSELLKYFEEVAF